jgi:integrase
MPEKKRGYSLTLTRSGNHWVKKYRGKTRHVAPIDTPRDRLLRILADKIGEWDAEADRRPVRIDAARMTARDLANRWLVERLKDVGAGKLTHGYYTSCRRAVRRMLRSVGQDTRVADLTPDHFSAFGRTLEGTLGTKALRRTVRIIVSLFNHAADEDWIEHPVKIGKAFRRLGRKADVEPRLPARTPVEFQKIIGAIDAKIAGLKAGTERDLASAVQLRAAVWLAVNGGYGSADLAELPRDVVDLDNAVIDYRRGKTKQERIVPLMPETIAALKPVLAQRPDDPLVFRTREGNPWRREIPKGDKTLCVDNFAQAYGKVLRGLGMKRPGHSFYELKDVHSELADETGDVHAAMRLVGHALPASRDPYVRVSLERLKAVVAHIRFRLTGLPQGPEQPPSGAVVSAPDRASRPSKAPAAPAPRSRSGGRAKRRPPA